MRQRCASGGARTRAYDSAQAARQQQQQYAMPTEAAACYIRALRLLAMRARAAARRLICMPFLQCIRDARWLMPRDVAMIELRAAARRYGTRVYAMLRVKRKSAAAMLPPLMLLMMPPLITMMLPDDAADSAAVTPLSLRALMPDATPYAAAFALPLCRHADAALRHAMLTLDTCCCHVIFAICYAAAATRDTPRRYA